MKTQNVPSSAPLPKCRHGRVQSGMAMASEELGFQFLQILLSP